MIEVVNETESKLQGLIDKSHQVLFSLKAVFPFQLVPDRIVIDMTKVTVEYRQILHAENIHTILLQDITQVEVTYILFFASLMINRPDVCMVSFLRRKDAVRAKQIITGLLATRREQINLEDVAIEGLADKLAEIGRPHAAE